MPVLRGDSVPCAMPACRNFRARFSPYCPSHWNTLSRLGHPGARALTRRDLKPFRTLAEHLLTTYADRPDTAAAITWCESLLHKYPDDRTGPQLARLKREGVTGRELLAAWLAVWGYADRYPASLPDDGRLTVALGRAALRTRRLPQVYSRSSFRKQSAYTPPAAVRALGMACRTALGVYLSRLLRLHERAHEAEQGLLRAIREGLPGDEVPACLGQRHGTAQSARPS